MQGTIQRLSRAIGFFQPPAPMPVIEPLFSSRTGLYQLLMAYYLNNDLYDELQRTLRDDAVWHEAIHAIRNPAFRVVEFYASHIWPGKLEDALPIVIPDKNQAMADAIQSVWRWSNFEVRKMPLVRKAAIYGSMFMKVYEHDDQVCFQLIDPTYVTDFDEDERGFVTYLRIDIPIIERDGDDKIRKLHTEIWSKDLGSYRVWEAENATFPMYELGTPTEEYSLESMGIDFVPFVNFRFRDLDEYRNTGVGAFTLQIDKIDEANRSATRLHEMLFRHDGVVWALEANATDPAGRPLPAPRITRDAAVNGADDSFFMGRDRLYRLPGNSKLRDIVPNLQYDSALKIVQDQMAELEHDMPELMYYRLTDFREVSGRAVQALLSPAIKRAEEVRGNMNNALVRANMMALTIGTAAGLFPNFGSFDDGDLMHSFEARDIIPLTKHEIAETDNMEATAAKAQIDIGVSHETALENIGFVWEDEVKLREEEDRAAAKLQQELAPPPVAPTTKTTESQFQLDANGRIVGKKEVQN